MDEQTMEQALRAEIKIIPEEGDGTATPAPEAGKETITPPAAQDPKSEGASEIEAKKEGEQPTPEVKKFKDSLGRELTPEQLFEEYNKNQDYSKRIEMEKADLAKQKADLETKLSQREQSKGKAEPESDPKNGNPEGFSASDKQVLEELKKLGFVRREDVVTKDDLESLKPQLEREIVNKAVRTTAARGELVTALNELEADFDGSREPESGAVRPKVDRTEVLKYIEENPGTNLSPLQIAKTIHQDDFIRYEAAKMVKAPNPLPRTEDAGIGEHNPPPPPSYSFNNESVDKGLREILKNA